MIRTTCICGVPPRPNSNIRPFVSTAFKPTSSLRLPARGLDVHGDEVEIVTTGRHDPCVGIRATKPGDLDGAIHEMISVKRPVIFDCRVANLANCFPMIPSGKPHHEMLLGEDMPDEMIEATISAEGKVMV